MKKPFDIFGFGDSGPIWIEAVETLETAKDHIEKLQHKSTDRYGVLDQRTGNRISFATKTSSQTQQMLAQTVQAQPPSRACDL
jgi:hypothetical protein